MPSQQIKPYKGKTHTIRLHHSNTQTSSLEMPVRARISYQTACLCFNAITSSTPAYLSDLRSGELLTQKRKCHLMRTQSLKVLPLKPAACQYIAIHATLTAMVFFLAYFYPSGPFTCIFPKTSPDFSDFFLRWLWLTTVPV